MNRVFLTVLLCFLLNNRAYAPKPKKLIYADLPYIGCQVCEKTVEGSVLYQ